MPNKISAARLLLAFLFFALLPLGFYWTALVVFVVAAGTDWVDGWYARKENNGWRPISDKILTPFDGVEIKTA